MFDIGISKLALIGVVALIVIGPEKLPRVARMVGTLLGKAQRYVNDVKAEVNRSMELDELRKAKSNIETAVRDAEQSVRTHASDFQNEWDETAAALNDSEPQQTALSDLPEDVSKRDFVTAVAPVYQHPRKSWRTKRSAVPQWYKTRHQVRTHVQSGAARVAGKSRAGHIQDRG